MKGRVLRLELGLGFFGVRGDADDDGVLGGEGGGVVAEFAGFGGAAGGVGLGVEVEDDGFALEGGEFEGVAGFVGEFEIGCFAAYFECHMFPLDAREV